MNRLVSTLTRITDFVKKRAMLDLSDKEIVFMPRLPTPDEQTAAVELGLPVIGRLYRHYKGSLYRVTGACTLEATQEPGVLYQALDPQARQDSWVRSVANFLGPHSPNNAAQRFTALHTPSCNALNHYLPSAILSPTLRESILSRYDESGRFFHARWHILDLFERALTQHIELTVEQSLAILFHDAVYVPGVAEGTSEKLSALLLTDNAARLGNFDLAVACRIIEDTAKHQPTGPESPLVLDLDLAGLADDAVEFCAADELVWLENRHLLEREGARKDFDTRRLKFLLNLADRGPLFHSPDFASREESARNNLEGLRQAWMRKYGKPET